MKKAWQKESLTQTVAATLDYLGRCSKNKLQGALNLQWHAPQTYKWSSSQKWSALELHHKHKPCYFKANWRGPKQMSSQAWAFWSSRKCWRLKSKPGLTRKSETLFNGKGVRRETHDVDWKSPYRPSRVSPGRKARAGFLHYTFISRIPS